MKSLLITLAAIEVGAGLGLLALPSTFVWLLLGSPLDTPVGMSVARVAGAALLSLGVACWFARSQGSLAWALLAAMLLYNTAVGAILAAAGIGADLVGIALWPAVVLHAAMAGWIVADMKKDWKVIYPFEK